MAIPFFALCIGSDIGISGAKRLHKALLYSFPLNDIRLLAGRDADKNNINRQIDILLDILIKKAKNSESPFLLFHYSGHGKRIGNEPVMDLGGPDKDLKIDEIFKKFTSVSDESFKDKACILFSFEMCVSGIVDEKKLKELNAAIIAPIKNDLEKDILSNCLIKKWTYNNEIGDTTDINLGALSNNVTQCVQYILKSSDVEFKPTYGKQSYNIPLIVPEPNIPKPAGIGDWDHICLRPVPDPFIYYKTFGKLRKELSLEEKKRRILIVNGEGPVGKSTAVKQVLTKTNFTQVWINCIPGMGKECILAAIIYGISKNIENVSESDTIQTFMKSYFINRNDNPKDWEELISNLVYHIEYYPLSKNKPPVVLVFEDVDNLINSSMEDLGNSADTSPDEEKKYRLTEIEFVKNIINKYLEEDRRSRIVLIQQDTNGPCFHLTSQQFETFQIRPISKEQIEGDDEKDIDRFKELAGDFGPQKPIVFKMLLYLQENDARAFKELMRYRDSVSITTCIAQLLNKIQSDSFKIQLLVKIAVLSNIADPITGKLLLTGPLPIKILGEDRISQYIDEFSKMGLITWNNQSVNDDNIINDAIFMHSNVAQRVVDEFSNNVKESIPKWHYEAIAYYSELLKKRKHISILYRLKIHSIEVGNFTTIAEILTDRQFLETVIAYGYFNIIEYWSKELLKKAKMEDTQNNREINLLSEAVRMAAMFNGDKKSYRNVIKSMHDTIVGKDNDEFEKAKAEYAILYNDYRESLRRFSKTSKKTEGDITQWENALTRAWIGHGYPFHPIYLLNKENCSRVNNARKKWYLESYLRGSCYAEMSSNDIARDELKDFFGNLLPKYHTNLDARIRGSIIYVLTIAEDLFFRRSEKIFNENDLHIQLAQGQAERIRLQTNMVRGQIDKILENTSISNSDLKQTGDNIKENIEKLCDGLKNIRDKIGIIKNELSDDRHKYDLLNTYNTCILTKGLLDIRPVEDMLWKAKYFFTRAQIIYEINYINPEILEDYHEDSTTIRSYINSALGYLNSNIVKHISDESPEGTIDRIYLLYLMGLFPNETSDPDKLIFPKEKYSSCLKLQRDMFIGSNSVLGKSNNASPHLLSLRSIVWDRDAPCKDPLLETDIFVFLARFYADQAKTQLDEKRKAEINNKAFKLLFIAAALSLSYGYQKGVGNVAEIFASISDVIESKIMSLNYALKTALWRHASDLVAHRSILMINFAAELIDNGKNEFAREILTLAKNAINEMERIEANPKLSSALKECDIKFQKIMDYVPTLSENGIELVIRKKLRFPVDIKVDIVSERNSGLQKIIFQGRLEDMSESGAAVFYKNDNQENCSTLKKHDNVRIIFLNRSEKLEMEGTIVRTWDEVWDGPATVNEPDIFSEGRYTDRDANVYKWGIAVRFEKDADFKSKQLLCDCLNF